MDDSGKIERAALNELRPLVFADDVAGHFEKCLGSKGFTRGFERASDANGWREACFEVQIAGTGGHGSGN